VWITKNVLLSFTDWFSLNFLAVSAEVISVSGVVFRIFIVLVLKSRTKPPGMQASVNRRLSQARTNWEGCGRKGIRHKKGGMMGAGVPLVRMGCPRCLCLRYRPLLHKIQNQWWQDVRWSGWMWVGECFFWYLPTRVQSDSCSWHCRWFYFFLLLSAVEILLSPQHYNNICL